MELKATEGRLIGKIVKAESKTKSGILLSNPQNNDLKEAVIVSVGLTLKDKNQKFEEGQHVFYGNYQGVEFKDNSEDYIILNQTDVLAVK